MIRFSVLGLALLVTMPTIWSALWTQDVAVDTAVIHFLIAVPVIAVLMELVRAAAKPVRRRSGTRRANGTSPLGG